MACSANRGLASPAPQARRPHAPSHNGFQRDPCGDRAGATSPSPPILVADREGTTVTDRAVNGRARERTLRGAWKRLSRAAVELPALLGSISVRIKLLVVGLLAAAGAASVAIETAGNPSAAPEHVAVPLRLLIIVALVLSGMFAYASRSQRPMGRLLIIAGLFSCVWLLNGSREEPAFTVGLVASGLASGLFCSLALAFPSGRIESALERRFILTTTAVMALGWLVAVLALGGPIIQTPLLPAPTSGSPTLSLGVPHAREVLAWVLRADWLIMSAGTALLVARRARRANRHTRLLLSPLVAIVGAQLSLLAAFTLAVAADAPSSIIRTAYVATAAALPLALFLGLARQRLSLGRVLARFVSALGTASTNDVQSAMASTLNDPALKVFYPRNGSAELVDADGARPSRIERDGRRQTPVQSGGRTLAVVDFDASLSDQEEYIQATAKSAVLWLEQQRLAKELAASKSSLEDSRAHLASTADEERRRIQRDLHDGAQQHLIGMHMKLELAVEAMQDDRARCAALLAEIGDEMGQTADDLRSLAANVFPPTLTEHGLLDALRSAIRRMGLDVRLQASGLGRHSGEIETQLYFVCLEALQNISKHAGPGVTATLRIWEAKRSLYVELRDTGRGFDSARVNPGSGLSNMHARLYALHGHLRVDSRSGAGTVIRAVVPIRAGGTGPGEYSVEGRRTPSGAQAM